VLVVEEMDELVQAGRLDELDCKLAMSTGALRRHTADLSCTPPEERADIETACQGQLLTQRSRYRLVNHRALGSRLARQTSPSGVADAGTPDNSQPPSWPSDSFQSTLASQRLLPHPWQSGFSHAT